MLFRMYDYLFTHIVLVANKFECQIIWKYIIAYYTAATGGHAVGSDRGTHTFLATGVGEAPNHIRRQLQDYSFHDWAIFFKDAMMVPEDEELRRQILRSRQGLAILDEQRQLTWSLAHFIGQLLPSMFIDMWMVVTSVNVRNRLDTLDTACCSQFRREKRHGKRSPRTLQSNFRSEQVLTRLWWWWTRTPS